MRLSSPFSHSPFPFYVPTVLVRRFSKCAQMFTVFPQMWTTEMPNAVIPKWVANRAVCALCKNTPFLQFSCRILHHKSSWCMASARRWILCGIFILFCFLAMPCCAPSLSPLSHHLAFRSGVFFSFFSFSPLPAPVAFIRLQDVVRNIILKRNQTKRN